ncbi:MAG: glycosyltransferase family 4 protein [Candidatus Omnitrophota bacterium]
MMGKNSFGSCLIIGVLPGSLINFRGKLIEAMIDRGVKVFAAANGRDVIAESQLHQMGAVYYPIRMTRTGLNPLAEIASIFDLIRLIRRVKPDMILTYTIKPNIYGALAARFCGIKKVFSMIEGLGYMFMPFASISHATFSFIARYLYRFGLCYNSRVFFLNPDDLEYFVANGYVSRGKASLLDGIGIDLKHYAQAVVPTDPNIKFLMISRLLKDKGIGEYIEAARMLKEKHPHVEFMLAGAMDENPNSIKQAELDMWRREGLIHYTGWVNDVRPLLGSCHVFVLPSYYREGIPRTTLEAMAAGRAVITVDQPGCRETVDIPGHGDAWPNEEEMCRLRIGYNGILVPAKDSMALAVAMEFFLKHPPQIMTMGESSRKYAQKRFDVDKVNAAILKTMEVPDGI